MKKKLILSIFCSIFIVIGLYYLSVLSYPIFHLSIELVSMLIGVFIFIIALMASKLKQLNFVSIIGPGFLVSSLVLFIHAITYQGLNLFPDYDSNLPTQLWIIANIVLVLSVLFGAIYMNHNKGFIINTIFISIFGVSLTILAFLKVFPVCYIEGTGLTAFKIYSEYAIIALYILSIAIITWKANIKKEKFYLNIIIMIIFLIVAEFMFTQYASVFGIENFLGHIIRAIGLIFIFNSIVIATFTKPITIIFKKISEDYKTEIYQLNEQSLVVNKELKFQTGEKADRAAELVIANKELMFQNEEKEKRAEELVFANEHDNLTGLCNRRYFEKAKEKLDKESSLPLSIIIGDINGLKLVNNAFGNAKGDQLLKDIASTIQSCCREQDIIAKIGGDEFGILLPNTEKSVAIKLMETIHNKCNNIDALGVGGSTDSIISFGVSTKETMLINLNDIFEDCENNLSYRKLLESNTSQNAILTTIKTTMVERCLETEDHSERLVFLSKKIGESLKLSGSDLDKLELLAKLHDIGKIGVDDKILNKPGKLDELEWIEMKKHPEIGYRIANSSPDLSPIAKYILSHHEKWDGTGYPQHLAGESIPLLSRIISVVDAYDAMTQDRPYRKALPKDVALSEIKKYSGTQFDPSIASLFLEMDLD